MILNPQALEQRARAFGLNMGQVCKAAGLARSIFTRWKSGDTSPQLKNLHKFNAALDRLSKRGPKGQVP
jgi:predicted transcriptional regulator